MKSDLNPMFYVTREKYGKFTRMRAAVVAYEEGWLSLDGLITWYDVILNGGVSF